MQFLNDSEERSRSTGAARTRSVNLSLICVEPNFRRFNSNPEEEARWAGHGAAKDATQAEFHCKDRL